MKPEPLPGARFTVSESRRGGATQGHAYERQPRLRLARHAAPHQSHMISATVIGVAEAIMVSNWELLGNNHAHVHPDALGATDNAEVFCIPGEVRSFVARIRSN